jgi:predicted acetyltransferase
LKQEGGHIGYSIRASERGKGYGTKMLKMVLPKVKELEIDRALITCDDTNIASQKVIEKTVVCSKRPFLITVKRCDTIGCKLALHDITRV